MIRFKRQCWPAAALLATAALLAIAAPAAAREADSVTTRSGQVLEGTIVEEDVGGIGIIVEKNAPAVFVASGQIERVSRGDEPDLFRSGLEAIEEGNYEKAVRQFQLARLDRSAGAWLYEYATYQMGRSCLLRGREERSIDLLKEARNDFLDCLSHNERTRMRPSIQHGLGELHLDAARFSTTRVVERDNHLTEAKNRFNILLLNATSGERPYNAIDTSRVWEIRARIGLLAVEADRPTKETSRYLLDRLDAQAAEAAGLGLVEEQGRAVWVRLDYLLRNGGLPNPAATNEAIEAIRGQQLALARQPASAATAERERIAGSLYLLVARIHQHAASLEEAGAADHEKKALLSILRVAILYRDSLEARSLAAEALLMAAQRLEKAGRLDAARSLVEEMKDRFAKTYPWRNGGEDLYKRLGGTKER